MELESLTEQVTTIKDTADNAINELSNLTIDFEDLKEQTSDLQMQTGEVAADIALLEEEQKNYLRYANYSTMDGSVVFTDGYGIDVFTVGEATYATVSPIV